MRRFITGGIVALVIGFMPAGMAMAAHDDLPGHDKQWCVAQEAGVDFGHYCE